MNLVDALGAQLGLGETEAKGLAGGLLGLVKSGLAEQTGPDAAERLETEVPEMVAWQSEGDTPEGEPGLGDLLGGLGGLSEGLGGIGGLLGGAAESAGLAGAIAGLVQRFGLDAGKATVAGGLVAQFLRDRLPADLLAQAKPLLAMLGGGSGGDDGSGGGAGGMLGGLFG